MAKQITTISKNTYSYSHKNDFKLVSDVGLKDLKLVYEAYGELNSDKNNVIVLHHSLSMSAHAANLVDETDTDDEDYDYDHKSNRGWWDSMIGPGKVLDTDKYYIICINNLGSCFGSTGPDDYNGQFPVITMHDIANSQYVLLNHLGIDTVRLMIGSSMGGMISLAWLQLYPETIENIFVTACAHKAYPINTFNRMIQREIINLDPDKSNQRKQGLKIARMLGFYNYRSSHDLSKRFDSLNLEIDKKNLADNFDSVKHTELYNYYCYNSEKFIKAFSTESYLTLLNAMDMFDLTINKTYHSAGFKNINKQANIFVVGIDSDILFPIYQQEDTYHLLVDSGYNTQFITHKSQYGHDAFLIDHDAFADYISRVLV